MESYIIVSILLVTVSLISNIPGVVISSMNDTNVICYECVISPSIWFIANLLISVWLILLFLITSFKLLNKKIIIFWIIIIISYASLSVIIGTLSIICQSNRCGTDIKCINFALLTMFSDFILLITLFVLKDSRKIVDEYEYVE